jgi:glycine hydroxymethyltransferase
MGTPALTTRGLKENDIKQVADFIDRGIHAKDDPAALDKIRGEVKSFAAKFPMPH